MTPQPQHFGAHATAQIADALAAIKATGRVAVAYGSTPGLGPGFYAHWVRDGGSLGLSIGTVSATEADAWLSVAIELAAYKPGIVQLTSREFGDAYTTNVLSRDGSLATVERRSRLEIRSVGGQYEVFLLERRYLRGEEPRDVRQYPQAKPFATLHEAAGYVGQFIADYEEAAAEDHHASVEAQRVREREALLGDAWHETQ